MPLKLTIHRASRRPTEFEVATERRVLDSAARALDDALANTAIDLSEKPTTAGALRAVAQTILTESLAAVRLTSESPSGPLHTEHSGWGPPVREAAGQHREVQLVDILDTLATLLGSADQLVWSEQQ